MANPAIHCLTAIRYRAIMAHVLFRRVRQVPASVLCTGPAHMTVDRCGTEYMLSAKRRLRLHVNNDRGSVEAYVGKEVLY